MGTNYYLHEKPDCECCGRSFESIHIGKSSGGWCFALRVYPDNAINTLEDWRAKWSTPNTWIQNEYGERISVADMESTIANRLWQGVFPQRHSVDGWHCIANGEGSWDYIVGEFS